MPTRFAMRELKLSYLDKVQSETAKFLNERVKHDFLRPDRELTLDLTVQEAEILISANDEVRAFADKGGLKDLHQKFNELTGRVEAEYFNVREHLAKTLQVIENKENELYDQLVSEFGLRVKKHGDSAAILDVLGLSSGDSSFDNLSIVEGAIEQGHERAAQLEQIRGWLHMTIGVKAKIFAIEADLKEQYMNYVAKNEDDKAYVTEELRKLVALRNAYQDSFSRYSVADFAKGDYDAFEGQLNELKEVRVKNLVSDFSDYEKIFNERQRIYHNFANDSNSESLTVFRSDLLQHLAGSIVVKEHRQRYQKEQFDRFISSLQHNALHKSHVTLRDFCVEYANMIEILISDSHNDRSPKIEANYDDFGEKTIRPINATIFYYFFSADRRKRTIA